MRAAGDGACVGVGLGVGAGFGVVGAEVGWAGMTGGGVPSASAAAAAPPVAPVLGLADGLALAVTGVHV